MRIIAGLLMGVLAIGGSIDARADVQTVKVKIDENCGPATISGDDEVKKRRGDVLLFNFTNECKETKTLLVCAVPFGESTAKPTGCKGHPEKANVTVGSAFGIAGATRGEPTKVHAMCDVAYPEEFTNGKDQWFCLFVSSGSAADTRGCERRCQDKKRGASEIAIEVEP